MPKQPAKPRKPPVRTRPVQIRVMVSEAEQKKLSRAARKADLPLSNSFVKRRWKGRSTRSTSGWRP